MRSISASDLHKILVLSSSLPPYIHHMFSLFNTSDHFTTFSPFSKDFLSNALKNTIRGYVEVFYEIDKHCVRIGVKDTGRGIPQNMLEKIFERFEKVDSFAQGVGLGLSICKSIVDKMNGRIQVYSQLGLGTTFIAELPCHSILVNE